MPTYTQGSPESMLSRAKIVWKIFKAADYSDSATAGAIGCFTVESRMDAHVNEYSGGGGFGLAQWTPKENCYLQGAKLGLSRSECETLEGQSKIAADARSQWIGYFPNIASVNPNASVNMPLSKYKGLTDIDQATDEWEGHFERADYRVANMPARKDYAKAFYKLLKGTGAGENGSSSHVTIHNNLIIDLWLGE